MNKFRFNLLCGKNERAHISLVIILIITPDRKHLYSMRSVYLAHCTPILTRWNLGPWGFSGLLDLGSGISQRGATYTRSHPGTTYPKYCSQIIPRRRCFSHIKLRPTKGPVQCFCSDCCICNCCICTMKRAEIAVSAAVALIKRCEHTAYKSGN